MADLDSLNIRVSASTDAATKSIDKLIGTLGKLSGAFNINGLDSFVDSMNGVSQSINGINEKPLKNLADAATKLSKIGNGSFNGILEGMRALQNIQLSDTLANINYIRDAMGKIGGKNGTAAGEALKGVASGLQAMNVAVPNIGAELTQLAVGVRALGTGQVVTASTSLTGVANGLREMQSIGSIPQIEGLAELGKAIAVFGYKSTKEAVTIIPQLASAFRQLIETLNTAPSINKNVIDLANAMANLLNSTKQMPPVVQRAGRSLGTFVKHSHKAQKAAFSLASAIGKLYATYWAFIRVGRWLGGNLKLASDLTETQNVVDHVFGSMTDSMEDFAKTAVETVGMSELTAKQIASRFQSMGKNMDITPQMMKQTGEFVETVTNGYAKASDSMADMSLNLTHLAGDMASFYNFPYEDVAEDLESIFTATTKPMRKYGIDLTVASLKAWALANGLNADIKNMTLAEKAMLRYQYVMAHTTAAQNDFIRTQETWANQIKIAQENLKRLRVILGQIGVYTFKPLVKSFNIAMNDILHLAESTFNALGKIFGWQIEVSDVGVLDDAADSLEDVADGYDDAGKEGKKFKNFLLGIDELNLLPDDKDKGNGDDDLAGLYGDMADAYGGIDLKKTDGLFDSLYDTLFKLGKRIGEVEKDLLKGIDWDAVYAKARNFGDGLADFLNGYLSDAELFYEKGKFIANGINTIANAIDAFFKKFDGWQLGVDIGSAINGFTNNLNWNVIRSAATEMAHDIAQTINGAFQTTEWDMVGHTIAESLNTVVDFFYTLGDEINWKIVGESIAEGLNKLFEDFDFGELAATLNKWAKGMLTALITALKRTDWKMIGRKIGQFISGIDIMDIASKIGGVLWEAINASVKLWYGLFDGAPIETAIVTALALPFSNRMFRSNFAGVISRFSGLVGTALYNDLSSVFNGSMWNTFLGGFMDTNVSGVFSEVANGVNAVSSQISPITKAVGGVAAIAGEFIGVKDAMYKCVRGSDDIGESIEQLVVSVGIATPALTLLFGVPTGLILSGATLALGAIEGIHQALDKIAEDNVISVLAKDMGDAGITLDEIAGAYKSATGNITGGIDKMNNEHKRISGMKDDLAEMLGGFSLIKEAAEGGSQLTTEALHNLVDDIGDVKKAWEDYIAAQYEWLIQSTINNMNFIKSHRDLTSEEKSYFTERINILTQQKEEAIRGVSTATQEVSDAWAAYYDALEHPPVDNYRGYGIPTYIDELYEKAVNATSSMVELGETTGVILDEDAAAIESTFIRIQQAATKLDLSNIDGSSLSNYAEAFKATGDEIESFYKNSREAIDEYVANMAASKGWTEEQILFETKEYYTQLGKYTEDSLDFIQQQMYDKFYKILASGNYTEAQKYAKEVITPFVESFPDVLDSEGKKIQPVIGDAINEIFDSAYTAIKVPDTEDVIEYQFEKGFGTAFWKIRDKYFGAGEDIGNALNEGFATTAGATSVIDDVTDSFDVMRKSGGQTANTILNINQNMKRLDASTLIRMKDEFDKTTLKAADMKTKVENLTSTFGTMKDKLSSSKTFEGVKKSADDVVTGFDNIRSKGIDAANILAKNLSKMTGQINTTYNEIMTDTDVFIVNLNGEFSKMFAADMWSKTFSAIPNVFKSMWEDTIKVMKIMWSEMATWINQNAKIEIPKVKIADKEIGGQTMQLKISKFDVGGSIPNNGSLFIANEKGPEVMANMGSRTGIMNTDQMEAAIANGMARALATNGQNVTVVLQGDASTLFTAVVKENNNAIMRTGSSPIRR